MTDQIHTFKELMDFCHEYKEHIFVSELINGKWKTLSLAELDMEKMMKWLNIWWERKSFPYRLIPTNDSEAETDEN